MNIGNCIPLLPRDCIRSNRCDLCDTIEQEQQVIYPFFLPDADLVYIYIKLDIMARQSISFTKPNDDWLKEQVDSQEYTSKSELINDLVRQARKQQAEIDWIRTKLDEAERSGFTTDSKQDILAQAKSSS